MSCTLFKLWMLVMAFLFLVGVFGIVVDRLGGKSGERISEVAMTVYMALLAIGTFAVIMAYVLGWLE